MSTNFNRFEILQRVLNYLNSNMILPARQNGLDILYRVHVVDANTVKVDGYLPLKTSGTPVNPADDFKQGCLWIGAQAAVFDDYSLKHDGLGAKLVRLGTPFRDHRYTEFCVNQEKPVFSLLLMNEIAETILDETAVEGEPVDPV